MGGFYVGRFETTGISAIPEVKRAKTNLSNENWFTMYINMKKIFNLQVQFKPYQIIDVMFHRTRTTKKINLYGDTKYS